MASQTPVSIFLFWVGFFVVFAGLQAANMWADPPPPIEVTATVVAHTLHSAQNCTRVVMHVPEEDQSHGMCWGADVHLVYPWDKSDGGNCTISKAVLEQHTKGVTESMLLEAFATGSSRSIFAHAQDGKCVLVAPPGGDLDDFYALSFYCGCMMLLSGGIILSILREWYEVTINEACAHYLQELLPTEGAVGGEGARKKTGRQQSWQPLNASAPLP